MRLRLEDNAQRDLWRRLGPIYYTRTWRDPGKRVLPRPWIHPVPRLRPNDLNRIVDCLEHVSDAVRIAAINTLATFNVTSSTDAIIQQLDTSSSNVRIAAIESLGVLGADESVTQMSSLLPTADDETQGAVLKALGRIGHMDACEPVFKYIMLAKGKLRITALETLVALGALKESVPILLNELDLNQDVDRGGRLLFLAKEAFGNALDAGDTAAIAAALSITDAPKRIVAVFPHYNVYGGKLHAATRIFDTLTR